MTDSTENTEQELTVECASCSKQRNINDDLEGVPSPPTRSDWEMVTSINEIGQVFVHEAYCPNHRPSTALKRLITQAEELSKSTEHVSRMTQKVSDPLDNG